MKSSSSIARISPAFVLPGMLAPACGALAMILRGLPASACPALVPILSGLWHQEAADEQRQDRGDADFGSKALAGSGGM